MTNKNTVFKEKTGKSIAKIIGGNTIAQIIAVISLPIISRIYTSEIIGVNATFTTLSNLISTASALTYPLALTLPKQEDEAKKLILVSLITSITTTTITSTLIWLMIEDFINATNLPHNSYWYIIFFTFCLLTSLSNIISQSIIRNEDFNKISGISWKFSAASNTIKISLGLIQQNWLSLVLSNILSIIAKIFLAKQYALEILITFKYLIQKKWSLRDLIKTSIKYKDFPIFRAPQALLFAASQSLPIIMIGKYFNQDSVGIFAIATTALTLPANSIGSAISQVFYPKITRLYQSGEQITEQIKKTTIKLTIASSPIFLAVLLFGESIFATIFGEKWSESGILAKILLLYIISDLANKPSGAALTAINSQKVLLILELLGFISKIIVFPASAFFELNFLEACALYSFTGAILNLSLIPFTIKLTTRIDKETSAQHLIL